LAWLKNEINKEKLISFSLSILIHGIIVIVLFLIEINYPSVEKNKPIELNIKIVQPKAEKVETVKPPEVKRKIHYTQKKKEIPKVIEKKIVVIDSTVAKQKVKIDTKEKIDSTEENLKFAATLLDSFLVHHPEYARFILEQQAKRLAENRKIVSRYEMVQKINDELHDYIQKNFPEGSEHAMSPYGGPGMQIPIDGIIDAIRDVFK